MVDYTSNIAGQTDGGVKITCILNEGAPTVTERTYGPDGYRDRGITWASEIYKNSWVTINADATYDTYVLNKGMPAVKAITAATEIIGIVITEPKAVAMPATTALGDSWAKQLAAGYYRIATVLFPCFTMVTKMEIVAVNTAAILAGDVDAVFVDASATIANALAGTKPVTLSGYDVANGGAGVVPLHSVPKGTDTYSILVGFTGGAVVVGA